ncbi:MAG: leucyl/phenylalanyl-tRNA--protein transferase [Alphaproteobacteria bacterium]|nr:leucyl/phenylalanyl-tRNA--protein transferase [Alphaproteobacteria bacterium]MCY4318767.1 leucyl/phenylalanyl-tRNA--protein transferase [Alphaproteobacteria bacterium]
MQISADILLAAYRMGFFPMANGRLSDTLYWLDPRQRGIIPLDGVHVSRRLARTVRQGRFEVLVDGDFDAVIAACAEPRTDDNETWINDDILRLYQELHRRGAAHSVECRLDGQLEGGLYGVSIGAAFFGESMFSRVRDASKVALVHLAVRLYLGGYLLLDTQFFTKHLATFGAIEISRTDYRRRLRAAINTNAELPCNLPEDALVQFLASARPKLPPEGQQAPHP